MAGTRALFASIGASVALVAAAALSLLAVSAVFAFGGWSDSPSESVKKPALVFAGGTPTQRAAGGAGAHARTPSPIVVAAPARSTTRAGSRSGAQAPRRVRPAKRPVTTRPAGAATSTPGLSAPVVRPAAPSPPAVVKKRTGDGVRKVGDGLSATVQGTGAALSDVTEPLAPPVSSAVQTVVDAVAALLSNATNGMAGVLDKLLPPK
jgi:hypothetical protein